MALKKLLDTVGAFVLEYLSRVLCRQRTKLMSREAHRLFPSTDHGNGDLYDFP